ncbi:patatin-like phospholipase family protein [Gordonia crocea]|uniref:PNPLA domain-containing protein n=1 Tax=Gordonia crocea TaxID=589162 RepID=A0A7M3SU10_9ACTN|nr:patatin-like phospholipase family protein [Gordonia crocea]GED96134.1 hypothetical protein nbrc107697_01730 [Gordonia crocea]
MADSAPLPNGVEFSAAGRTRHPGTDRAIAIALLLGLILIGAFAPLAHDDQIMTYEFTGDPNGRADILDRAVWADFGFIAGYTLALGAVGLYLRARAFTGAFRKATSVLLGMLGVAALADVAENIGLLFHNGHVSAPFATLKFVLIVPVLFLVPTAAFVAVRSRRSARWWNRHHGQLGAATSVFTAPVPDEDPDQYRWRRAYWAPTVADPRTTDTMAVCLSGGGIRAGSVALGALQALSGSTDANDAHRGEDRLDDADYIISVSGGGFLAGAFLQAAHRVPDESVWPDNLAESLGAASPEQVRTESLPVTEAFKQGSVEYDRVRRHASYIADSPRELAYALAVVAKNMLLTLASVFVPAVVLGLLLGVLYAQIPLAAVGLEPEWGAVTQTLNTTPSLVVIGVLAGIAFLALVGANGAETRGADARMAGVKQLLTTVGQVAAGGAAVVALATFAIPWAMRLVWTWQGNAGGSVLAPASGVVALNYIAVLAAMLWRKRGSVGGVISRLRGKGTAQKQALPQGALQLVIVLVTLAVLVASWLLTVSGAAAWAVRAAAPGADRHFAVAVAFAAALIALIAVARFDVTSTSLHPFYRRRLARAFAMRRVRLPEGQQRAQAYPDSESTELSLFTEPRRTGFSGETTPRGKTPVFVFAAAAAVSGEDKPASGQTSSSYVFSADYVGGPDLGYVRTDGLARLLPHRIERDMTVQAAVSISGAAFASAMGRAARGYQSLLAVSGARLGSWLPNPRFLDQSQFEGDNPSWPHGFPSYRGLGYLFREVFGLHSSHGRLVQITDGGHYENLGLVEALRRRCTTIVAVDASGDSPPSLTTFAEAMRLAEAELGVRFTINPDDDPRYSPTELAPGTAPAVDDASITDGMQTRLAASPIVRVAFTYPDAVGGRTGTLILAKAVLTADLPSWLLTYADNHPVFPHDSTSDQWFDEGQFAAYTELGRHIGAKASAALEQEN